MASNWRDTLMDYGKILGDKSSRSSNSAFFTVDGDLDEKQNEELHLRQVLEIHFRPLFQRFVYGGEKMACHDLRKVLRDSEYRNRLPPDKVQELADLTDFNMGRAIKYEEFVRIVLGRHDDSSSIGSQIDRSPKKSHLGKTKGFFKVVCRNTTNQVMVDDRLDKYRCFPPPFFMIAITVVQIIVFIVQSQESNVTSYPLKNLYNGNTPVGTYGCDKAMYLPTRRHEAWRFVTYCFLHPGYIDLIFNIIIQLLLGIPLEIAFSTWRMVVVYFCGVIVGSLSQSVVDHYVGLTGAAGGAYAVMAAHMIAMWQNRAHLNNDLTESKRKRILCSLSLRAILMLIILIPQVTLAVYRRWYFSSVQDGRVGITAHIGGLVAGFILGPSFLKDNKRRPWQDSDGFVCLFLAMAFVGGCVIFNIVYTGYPTENYS
uniref:Peptidase S54 rhomboid domain-containing protein n=1 Tax=Arion vulgaris TaxID=1028688 RepID=A0A0B7AG69_9EUPU